jgi:hypothetical protein
MRAPEILRGTLSKQRLFQLGAEVANYIVFQGVSRGPAISSTFELVVKDHACKIIRHLQHGF